MYIDVVPNRNSTPAVLLRESYRQGGKVRKRTLANLSALPQKQIELIRRSVKGEEFSAPINSLRSCAMFRTVMRRRFWGPCGSFPCQR